MPLSIWLVKEPWDFVFNSEACISLEHNISLTIAMDSILQRYLIVPTNAEVIVGINFLKKSFPFIWKNKVYEIYAIPIERYSSQGDVSETQIKINFDQNQYYLVLASQKSAEFIVKVKQFIKWQIELFQEILTLQLDSKAECKTKSYCRRSWKNTCKVWLNNNEEGFSENLLIVKLAQDSSLQNSLRIILNKPNKVLKRQRKLQSIGSISEFDTTCLQWYVKQPGVTIQEKGGPQQKILGVTREESFELYENRVTKWVTEKLIRLSSSFLMLNEKYHYSEKCTLVRGFNGVVKYSYSSSAVKDVKNCEHTPKPNIVLSNHFQYKKIWETYLRLRKEEHLEEECWKWQAQLWGETCRQILSSLLTEICERSNFISVDGHSMNYIRNEQMDGYWVESPLVPGPFKTSYGNIDYIDLRDGLPYQNIVNFIRVLGASQILRQVRINGITKILVIWFWNHATGEFIDEFYRCQVAMDQAKQLFENDSVSLTGIIFVSHIEGENFSVLKDQNCKISLIKITKNFSYDLERLLSEIEDTLRFFDN